LAPTHDTDTGTVPIMKSRAFTRLVGLFFVFAALPARGDIFQWEFINPTDSSQGKLQSTTLAPDGAGVDAVPGVDLSYRDLTMAHFVGVDLSYYWNGARFVYTDFTATNLSQADLTNARLSRAILAGADFTGAEVRGAWFLGTTSQGFTAAQLYSTASYQAHDLTGVVLDSNDLSGWNFAGQNFADAIMSSLILTGANFTGANLRGAQFFVSRLTDANFTNAEIQGASFRRIGCGFGGCLPHGTSATGFSLAQLYSTASYRARDLRDTDFSAIDLAGGNFASQNLTNASFYAATLSGADFTDAEIRGANFGKSTVNCPFDICPVGRGTGITFAQLYSTASYKARDLSGIGLGYNDLAGGNFVGQNLANASFYYTTLTGADFHEANLANASFVYYVVGALTGADFTSADTRGAQIDVTGATITNLIRPDGHTHGLDLNDGERLVVRDHDGGSQYGMPFPPISITVDQHFLMGPGGTLRIVFEVDEWGSTISFAPGIPVTLGGTLELTFAADVNLASQVGRTLRVFNWSGVSPAGQFIVSSPYTWDLSNLYTSGEVTLTAVPESHTLLPLGLALTALVAMGRLQLRFF
jgi:uncharacterized protein YjbI with pentapeptide repeats